MTAATDRANADGPGCPAELRKAAPDMLAALESYIRVVDSDAFKRWEGAAALTHIRQGTSGYDGEPLPTDAIRAAIAKAKGTAE